MELTNGTERVIFTEMDADTPHAMGTRCVEVVFLDQSDALIGCYTVSMLDFETIKMLVLYSDGQRFETAKDLVKNCYGKKL